MMVPGAFPSFTALTHTRDSKPPAAPRRWPVMDLVLEMGTCRACSPRASLRALVSTASFMGVLVPWAFT